MILRLLLRILSLAAKFGLTVVLARTLGFSAVADYGLAVAVSVVASKVLGLGFSAELNRRLSGVQPAAAIRGARTLRGVYGAAYLLILAGVFVAWRNGWLQAVPFASPTVLCEVALVAIAEHYALEANSYVFSLHRAQAASMMLFVRTGAWAAFAIAGLLAGSIVDIHAVFLLWLAANLGVIVWAWIVVESVDRHEADEAGGGSGVRGVRDMRDVRDVRDIWAGGAAFYIASILLSGLQYAERFIAAPYLSGDELGRYVFAWATANAVQTVAYATVVVTAGPRLAKTAMNAPGQFGQTTRRAVLSVVALTVCASIGILSLHRPLFGLAHESIDATGLATLGILLASFVLRSVSDLLWVSAIALKEGRRVAFGMIALAALSVPSTWWLISRYTGLGVAVAHLWSSLLITAWLAWVVRRTARDASFSERARTGDERAA